MRLKRSVLRRLLASGLLAFLCGAALIPAATAQSKNPRDFKGTWMLSDGGFFLGVGLPYTVAGQNLTADRLDLVKAGHSMASPHLTCRPTGVAGELTAKSPILILQTPKKMYVITQEDREVRYVYMNRSHPKHLTPTYSGDAVGHWDADTLVIDAAGYNGRGQLDEVGSPQSAQSHVVERWSKSSDGNTLTVHYTFSDPVFYTKPFQVTRHFKRVPGGRIGDYDCAENPRSDDFDNLTFPDDSLKPVCERAVVNDVAADKVVCKPPQLAVRAQ